MTFLRSLAIAGVLATSTFAAFAQASNAPVAPTKDMPMDCANAPMKRHDHGMEHGSGPTAGAMPCAPDGAASRPAAAQKKVLRHDHAKFHKNQ